MSDMDNGNLRKLSGGIYGSGYNNGHTAQNYYLTGDGNSDPSPNGSNETGQTEFWNSMKSQMMHENLNDAEMNYNTGYNMLNNQLIDPNAFMNSYSPYYQTPGYQTLDESDGRKKINSKFVSRPYIFDRKLMTNFKNSMISIAKDINFYDEMNNGTSYAGTTNIGNGTMINSNGGSMVMDTISSSDTYKTNLAHSHLPYGIDDSLGDYSTNRTRVMNEIIV